VAGDLNAITLRVRDIAQLFNTLDAPSFRIRDILPAVDQYIVDWEPAAVMTIGAISCDTIKSNRAVTNSEGTRRRQ